MVSHMEFDQRQYTKKVKCVIAVNVLLQGSRTVQTVESLDYWKRH